MSTLQLVARTTRTGKAARLFTFFILCLLTLGIPFRARASEKKCQAVSGSIAGNVIGSEPTVVLGTVTGDLGGAVTATVTSLTPNPDGSINLELEHTFVTEARDSLKTRDEARWVPVLGSPNVFRMTTQYTILGGTGKFRNATGMLENHGEADANTGLVTLGYSGRVCTPKE